MGILRPLRAYRSSVLWTSIVRVCGARKHDFKVFSQPQFTGPTFNMDNPMSSPLGAMFTMMMQHMKNMQETQITFLQNGSNNKLNALCNELPYTRRSRSASLDCSEETPTCSDDIVPVRFDTTNKASNPQETIVDIELNNAQRTTAPIEPQTRNLEEIASSQSPQKGDVKAKGKPQALDILAALKERQSEKNKLRKEKEAAEKLMKKEKEAAEEPMKKAERSGAHETHKTEAERSNHKKVAASSETKKANANATGKRPCEGTTRARKDKYQ